MTCYEVQNWMLTEESPERPSSEVRAHVRVCATCRHSYHVLVRVIQELQTAPLPPLSPTARERLLASLEPRGGEINGVARPTPPPPSENGHSPSPSPDTEVREAAPRRSLRILRFPGVAVRALGNARPWVRWTTAAAAALLCVGLGMGIMAFILHQPPDLPGPQAQGQGNNKPELEEKRGLLEARTLEAHLDLAEKMSPMGNELLPLINLAENLRNETFGFAQKKADELNLLVWLHGQVLYKGLMRKLKEESGGLTPESRNAAMEFLSKTEQNAEAKAAEAAATKAPEYVSAYLRQLSRQAREVKAAIEKNANPSPLPPPPPADSQVVLQVIVLKTVDMAFQIDPIARAESSTMIADVLATRLEGLERVDSEEAKYLTQSLNDLFNRGILSHLSQPLNPQSWDAARQKRVSELMQRLNKTGDRLENKVLRRMPSQFHGHIQPCIDLVHKIRQEPPKPGGKMSWRKPYGYRGTR